MIGRNGERGSGISVLASRHDDDDDDALIFLRSRHFPLGGRIYGWRISYPSFDPRFWNLACLATLRSCDATKLFLCE